MAEKLPEAEKGRKITVKIIKPQSTKNSQNGKWSKNTNQKIIKPQSISFDINHFNSPVSSYMYISGIKYVWASS